MAMMTSQRTTGVGEDPGHAYPPNPAAVARVFDGLLAATHLCQPDELPDLLTEQAELLGAEELVLYLIDFEQSYLTPVPSRHATDAGVVRVDGTIGGRAFSGTTVVEVDSGQPERRQLWVPLIDGTERLGVFSISVPAPAGAVDPDVVAVIERFGHLAAQLVVGKSLYGDAFELIRRRQPMSVAAELQRRMLPPSSFATQGFVVSGFTEPCYSAGGDSYDYAINGPIAHLAVFDAMGHGTAAAATAAVAVAAYRNSRRRLLDLPGTYAAVDTALDEHFDGDRFATAVVARLDLRTGSFRWVSAGHPAPLLIREGRLVKTLDMPARTPFGMALGDNSATVGHESLEPGDRVLLYTDGLTEARTATGEFFTAERLAEFLERQSAAALPAPETLRRLRHAIFTYHDGQLQDDATALLVEWRRGGERAMVPPTVD
jgi:hypothetical protein